MVVDSRYQRVTAHLILVQALQQLLGGALLFISLYKGAEPNKFVVLSVVVGLLAILVGELERRTMTLLVLMYTSLSSIAAAFSVMCIIQSELFLKVAKQNVAAITSYELFDAARVALDKF